jgi:hypothetical protein
VFHKQGAGADVLGALRAIKVVLLELFPDLWLEFVEQVPFRRFFSNHRCVVHGFIPPHTK